MAKMQVKPTQPLAIMTNNSKNTSLHCQSMCIFSQNYHSTPQKELDSLLLKIPTVYKCKICSHTK